MTSPIAAGIVNIRQLVAGPTLVEEFQTEKSFEVYNYGWNSGRGERLSGGQILEDSASGLAASILSLSTNAIATSLVMYKAWYVCKVTVHDFGR